MKLFKNKSTNALAALTLITLSANAAKETKPNVIIIITDDQGYGDVAALGNKVIKTPNMDRLHNEGVSFSNFHSGTTSAPSRSGLMSGVDGNRTGVWHTIGGCNFLREKFVLMPQIFKNNGYNTAIFGKWHLGDASPFLPEERGFDEAVYHGGGGVGQTPDFWDNDYFDDTYMHNGKPQKYKGYCTDVFFGEAIKYIESKKGKPFMVYLSTNAPHGPLNVEEKYYNLYKDETSINDDQKAYYGMLTNIDDNMGLLDKKLQELGIKDNTIVIFMSDNGTQYGHRKVKGGDQGYNAGMRGYKGSQYEGGHRVPLFIQWKNGNLVGGKTFDKLTMNFDILPTLVDLCKLQKVPSVVKFDGVSLASQITNKSKDWPQRYCVVDNNRRQQPIKWNMCAVMDNEWRLIDGKELYNLKSDSGQTTNIASQYPERVNAMRIAYENWWETISKDFSRFEAYKIGGEKTKECIITVMDVHSEDAIAWDQELVRDPEGGKKPAFADGFWMIDIQKEGKYEISLSRWPRESGFKFSDSPAKLGAKTPWYQPLPEGKIIQLEKSILDIDALHVEKPVDMNTRETTFKVYLNEGRKQLKAAFTKEGGIPFSAYYVYIKKVD